MGHIEVEGGGSNDNGLVQCETAITVSASTPDSSFTLRGTVRTDERLTGISLP